MPKKKAIVGHQGKLLQKTKRFLDMYAKTCPELLKTHYEDTLGMKLTRNKIQDICAKQKEGRKQFLKFWSFALKELKDMHEQHEKLLECAETMDKDTSEEKQQDLRLKLEFLEDDIERFREEAQTYDEMWPFLTYSWDMD
jgi:benzoyl-CoA reductase/2-hydroxyglutaryl-CoA dehydratase subunit BcrC/BadD/HgdB